MKYFWLVQRWGNEILNYYAQTGQSIETLGEARFLELYISILSNIDKKTIR